MIGRTVVSTQVMMRHLSRTKIYKKLTMSEYTIPINDLFVRSSVPLGIPGLATDELRIAFIQATEPLCPDVQRKIWEEVLKLNRKMLQLIERLHLETAHPQ